MSDDVRRRLDEAARRPVPPPDPAFADALEARLRVVAGGLPPAPTPPPRRHRPATGWWIAAAGAAVAIVMIVAVIGLGNPAARPAPGPALAQAVNVQVALADGTVLEDPDGLLLPEGAVVTVGEGGSARIGDTELGPGDVARIEGGRLEVQHPSPVGVVPAPTTTQTPRQDPTTPLVTSAPTREPPAASPSPAPQRTGSPSLAPDPTPQPTRTEPTATAQPTPTPTPAIVRPRLRARLIDGPRIAARWTATWGAARYVLVATASRSGPAPDPVYPGSRVIGEWVTPPDRAVRFRVPDGVVEIRLMVVALRENERVLRRSRIVTITIPPPGDAAGSSPVPMATSGPSPSPSPSVPPPPAPVP